MIILHRLKGAELVLNADHIECVEAYPDTVITLTNEKKYVVAETVPEVIEKVTEYKRNIFHCPMAAK